MPDNLTFNFSQHLQDCLLRLSSDDDEVAQYLSTLVKPSNFINDSAQFVCKAIQKFYLSFAEAPKDHLADIIESELSLYPLPEERISILIEYLHHLQTVTPNKDYVLSNLSDFIRHTNIVAGIIQGARLIERGEYNEAERTIAESFKTGITKEDVGLQYFKDFDQRARPVEVVIKTGIEALDKWIGGVSREELTVWLAPTNVGKSWSLIHCAKEGLFQGKKVLFYTLEMVPAWVATRVDMGMCAMGTVDKEILLPPSGEPYHVQSIFENQNTVKEKVGFVETFGGDLIIKGLAKGGVTLSKLRLDLDMLEVTHHFIPDIIIIDYADLMSPETHYTEFRHDIAAIYRGLREIALERKCAMITASQSNRASIGAEMVTLKHFAEDIQKAMIADIILSLCQTDFEMQDSKLRIFCCKNRNGVKGFQVENWYSYNIGQFSLYSRDYETQENRARRVTPNQ